MSVGVECAVLKKNTVFVVLARLDLFLYLSGSITSTMDKLFTKI